MSRRLTKDQYQIQLSVQGYRCWICKGENLPRYGQEPERLSEDHCHYTDANRRYFASGAKIYR
jgi:hypothetical protein